MTALTRRVRKRKRADIELVVRGVLVNGDYVLVVHSKHARNTYLPGGHIEFGESAVAALKREIREELGFRIKVTNFLGAVEHGWIDAGGPNHEINLIFRMEFDCPAPGQNPLSREAKIEFRWQKIENLRVARFEPRVLQELLPKWLARGGKSEWGSTIRSPGKRRE